MNTTYFLNLVANNLYRGQNTPSIPAAYYIGLSKTAPAADGTGVSEPPTSEGYTRVALVNLSEPTDGVVTNSDVIKFPESTGAWGTVTHYAIYDAATAGNLLMYGALGSSRSIEADTEVIIKAGFLKLSAQNPA